MDRSRTCNHHILVPVDRFVIWGTRRNSTTNCSNGTNVHGYHIPWPTHEMILTDHKVDMGSRDRSVGLIHGINYHNNPAYINRPALYNDLLSTACPLPLRKHFNAIASGFDSAIANSPGLKPRVYNLSSPWGFFPST